MKKTIHYRTIEWFGNQENTIQLLEQVLVQRPNVADTIFNIGAETIDVRHRAVGGGIVRLHFNASVPGAKKGAAAQAAAAPAGDIIECTAPAHHEFSEREVAVVVRGSQLGFVAEGYVRAPFVEKLIRYLLNLQHGTDLANRFNLSAQADAEKIQQLMQNGVTYLDLGLVLPHVEAEEQVDAQPRSIGENIGRNIRSALSARFLEDHDEQMIDQLAQANARLIMKFKKNAPLEQIDSLTALAQDAVDDDDQFKLKTKGGATYSKDQLIVSSIYNQPGPSRVLNYMHAWNSILAFMDEQI